MVPNKMDKDPEANIRDLKTSVAKFAAAVTDSARLNDQHFTRLEDRLARLEEKQAATDK
jgi:hypothetical protein